MESLTGQLFFTGAAHASSWMRASHVPVYTSADDRARTAMDRAG